MHDEKHYEHSQSLSRWGRKDSAFIPSHLDQKKQLLFWKVLLDPFEWKVEWRDMISSMELFPLFFIFFPSKIVSVAIHTIHLPRL